MWNFSLLVVGFLSAAAFAEPHGHRKHGKDNGTDCGRLLFLQAAQKESANTTFMNLLQQVYPKKAERIQKAAANAAANIAQIQSNHSNDATFGQQCAHQMLVHQCIEKGALTHRLSELNNQPNVTVQRKTLLQDKLNYLESNKTLQTECSKLPQPSGKGGKGGNGGNGGKGGNSSK
jgi:hypothetical protein